MTSVLGVPLTKGSVEMAAAKLIEWARMPRSRCICVANVHVIMQAYDSAAYRITLQSADMVVPDGMPLVWMMRLKGVRGQSRVYGPAFMRLTLRAAARQGIPVGLYGSTQDVLDTLAEKITRADPRLQLVFRESPPFGDALTYDDIATRNRIRRSGARILFVGLGCPKQENWMAAQRGAIPTVMLGVGAAFDFLAGTKPQAPRWMQSTGLEWLFRLVVEPRRLWKRYLVHNPRFIALAVAELLGIWRRQC